MRDSNLNSEYQSHLNRNSKGDSAVDDLTIHQAETLLASMDDLVFLFDKNRNFLKCFQPESSDFQPESSELFKLLLLFPGKNLSALSFPAEVLHKMQFAFNAAEETGLTQTIDYCLPFNKETRWYNSKISVTAVSGFIVVARDITSWKKSVLQLEENEKRYHLLADNTTDIVALYNPCGTLAYFHLQSENFLELILAA